MQQLQRPHHSDAGDPMQASPSLSSRCAWCAPWSVATCTRCTTRSSAGAVGGEHHGVGSPWTSCQWPAGQQCRPDAIRQARIVPRTMAARKPERAAMNAAKKRSGPPFAAVCGNAARLTSVTFRAAMYVRSSRRMPPLVPSYSVPERDALQRWWSPPFWTPSLRRRMRREEVTSPRLLGTYGEGNALPGGGVAAFATGGDSWNGTTTPPAQQPTPA